MTKRSLLSDINNIYDPLGFIAPVLIKGEIFLQRLWLLKLNWDINLPSQFQEQWKQFYDELKGLEILKIPRQVINTRNYIQLYGFSDASQDVYEACVYINTKDDLENWTSILYTSKSRVAPIHQTTTPRLELYGAVLLAKLIVEKTTELERIGI